VYVVTCHPVRICSCVHELLLVIGRWRKTKIIMKWSMEFF